MSPSMRFCYTLSWKGLNVWTLPPLLLGMVAHTTPLVFVLIRRPAGWPAGRTWPSWMGTEQRAFANWFH